MDINKWRKYFFDIAQVVASKSKDPSTKVGCVIIDGSNGILSAGYNGAPRGVNDSIERYTERPMKYSFIEHAERNALYHSARNGIRVEGSTIYIYGLPPCTDCARGIIQSGIREVYVLIPDSRYNDKWAKESSLANQMFLEAGITFKIYEGVIDEKD